MSIERSVELLRTALPWMSRQAAALHPVSYAVWFEYVARTNPSLSAAIEDHLAREGRLDEFATQALFKRHVADVDPESAQRVADGVQRVLAGVGEAASAAGAHTARFGASLAQLAGALERGDAGGGMGQDASVARNGPTPRLLADVVAEVIADTGTMRSQIGGLQQRLTESRREIERLRDEVRRARDEALRDSLTGLANRRAFDQALAACLLARDAGSAAARAPSSQAAAARAAGAAVDAIDAAMASPPGRTPAPDAAPAPAAAQARCPWLLVSDVDHFVRIGQTYGREFGDHVLRAVAEALRGEMPAGATLARLDGEAFALLAPELDDAAAGALAERVRAHIGRARIRRPGRDEAEPVTLSLGLAPWRAGELPSDFMARAQAALVRAKAEGRDRVVLAD